MTKYMNFALNIADLHRPDISMSQAVVTSTHFEIKQKLAQMPYGPLPEGLGQIPSPL